MIESSFILNSVKSRKVAEGLFLFFLVCVAFAIFYEAYFLLALPVLLPIFFLLVGNLRLLFIIMIASIPLSIELNLGSVHLDFPDEIFNIFFFLLLPGFVIFNFRSLDLSFIRHPIPLTILAMFIVSVLSTIFSVNTTLSIKYLLAKSWYIVSYFIFAAYFIKDHRELTKIAKPFILTATIAAIYVFTRHLAVGLSFKDSNFIVDPFFSNHVNYAIQLLVVLPFIWMIWQQNKRSHKKRLIYILTLIFLLIALWFSFTRAAIGAAILSVPFYYIIKWKLAKPVFFIGLISIGIYVYSLVKDNHFFEYAPNYNKTVSHIEFDDLLTATYNFEDISTMERVYRWVAARYMIIDKPWLGVGPNNFYDTYRPYTIKSFTTYVSNNPEKSTVHSYILLLAIEQGIFSSILYLILIYFVFTSGQSLYHKVQDPDEQIAIMAALICFFSLIIVLMINDVVESDKEGSFFFLSMAIIARLHWNYIKKSNATQPLDSKNNASNALE